MYLFTLTPRNLGWTRNDACEKISGRLSVYNWFVGVHAYSLDSLSFPRGVNNFLIPLGGGRYMIPYIEETLQTLYEKDRLLLVQSQDFTNNTNLGSTEANSAIVARLNVIAANTFEGNQLLVTFDIESIRRTEVQLFVNMDHYETIPVNARCKRSILVDVEDIPNFGHMGPIQFTLRPTRRELYVYSVRVDLF